MRSVRAIVLVRSGVPLLHLEVGRSYVEMSADDGETLAVAILKGLAQHTEPTRCRACSSAGRDPDPDPAEAP